MSYYCCRGGGSGGGGGAAAVVVQPEVTPMCDVYAVFTDAAACTFLLCDHSHLDQPQSLLHNTTSALACPTPPLCYVVPSSPVSHHHQSLCHSRKPAASMMMIMLMQNERAFCPPPSPHSPILLLISMLMSMVTWQYVEQKATPPHEI